MSIDDDWVTVDGVRYVPEAPLKADIERLQAALEAIKERSDKGSWAYLYADKALAKEGE